jgi:hypothetical protein
MDDDRPGEPDVARLFAPVAVEDTFAGVLTEAGQVLGGLDEQPDQVDGVVAHRALLRARLDLLTVLT